MFRIVTIAAALSATALFTGGPTNAAEGCKLFSAESTLATQYDLVGPEACEASCTSTDGCAAWSYTPHNFNPKSGPGECRLLASVETEEEHPKDFCGRIGG